MLARYVPLQLVGLILIAMLFFPLSQANLLGQPPRAANSQDIARWVKELDADQFDKRVLATDNLILAGRAAIEPLAKALSDCNLEVATRGVYVLREISLCGDIATEETAETVLRELAKGHTLSASRLSRETLGSLDQFRQRRALRQLRELGAVVKNEYPAIGVMGGKPVVAVVINEAWQGKLEDLTRLKWLRGDTHISFDGQRITDAWIQPLKSVSELQHLTIKHARITDQALQAVCKLEQLKQIDLMYTPVTDGCLPYLRQIRTLRALRLYGTKITVQGTDQLKTSLPRTIVDFKMGAFMGVRCQKTPWICAVNAVVPKTGAATAGIRRGDKIIRYAGKEVRNFESLQQLIAMNKAGDTVTIQVARGQSFSVALRRQAKSPLGLDGKVHPLGCEVTRVVEDGVAAGASVRVGDVISRMNQQPVLDIDALKKAYDASPLDRPSSIEVYRGLKILNLKLTFGEWQETS